MSFNLLWKLWRDELARDSSPTLPLFCPYRSYCKDSLSACCLHFRAEKEQIQICFMLIKLSSRITFMKQKGISCHSSWRSAVAIQANVLEGGFLIL